MLLKIWSSVSNAVKTSLALFLTVSFSIILEKNQVYVYEKEIPVEGMDNVESEPNLPVPNSIKRLFANEISSLEVVKKKKKRVE